MPRNTSGAEPDVTWGHSTVRTACPLDCPDSCTLDVTVENGRVVKIDGGDAEPDRPAATSAPRCAASASASTARTACSIPAVRKGAEGRRARSTRVTLGRSARPHRAADDRRSATRSGAEAILPFCYGGSNGLLDAGHHRRARCSARFGTSRLARTVCAAPTGAANMGALRQDAGRHLPGLRARAADRAVGREPVGVRHSPRPVSSRKRAEAAARSSSSIDPRATSLARQADLHLAPQARHRPAVALALHRYLFDERATPTQAFLARAHHAAPTRCARAPTSGRSSARREVAGIDAADLDAASPSCTRRRRRR